MKKLLSLALALSLAASLAGTALAAPTSVEAVPDSRITVYLDGTKLSLTDSYGDPTVPLLVNDNTYLPLRFLAETLGLDVQWDEAKREVLLYTEDYEAGLGTSEAVKVTPDASISVLLNNQKVTLYDVTGNEVEPILYKDTTWLPLRAVADLLDVDVNWEDETRRIDLTINTDIPVDPDEPAVTTLAYGHTTNGDILGYCEDGVYSFYGVPFAQAERFHMPEAPEAWQGYKTCMMQGEVCPQNKTTMEQFDFMAYSTEMVENEDTMLNLNVWTTDMDSSAKKPVIVWIHGGGYTTGGSMEKTVYDGANMADYGDVVFVSPNHRLNVLGYLDLSAYGEEYANSGNVGMADLVFALEWVRDNIANFGGDPNNVTIVGQSGGGSKVTTLMGMPAARGLFHKAVAISGGSAQITQTTEATQAKAAKVLEILGITAENIKDIETVDYRELLAAYNEAGYSAGPTVDGDYIPTGTYELSKDIPFMAGNVLGEFSTNVGNIIFSGAGGKEAIESNVLTNISEEALLTRLTQKYGDADTAAKVIANYKAAYPGHNPAEVLYINNRTAGMSCYALLSAMESYGGTCYTYMQAASYPFFGGIVPIHTAGDVPLWFHNVEKIPAWVNGETAKFEVLSDQMSTALVNFAKTGDPSSESLKWEPWTSETDGIMVFDAEGMKVTTSMRYHHEDDLFASIPAGGSGFPF